jgi:hypothetical protein
LNKILNNYSNSVALDGKPEPETEPEPEPDLIVQTTFMGIRVAMTIPPSPFKFITPYSLA